MRTTPPPEELVAHQRFLRGLARTLVVDAEHAEDLVQASLLAALAHPPRSADALRAFLATVVRNLASNLLRGEARRAEREAGVARAALAPSAHELQERLELERAVVEAVLALPDAQRRAVYLRWYEDLPPREIARRLELPLETVRSHLKRGHERLRRALDERYGERRAWVALLAGLARRPSPAAGALSVALFATLALVAALAALRAPAPAATRGVLAPVVSADLNTGARAALPASDARVARVESGTASVRAVTSTPAASAPARGSVVDARTGEPVPEIELALVDAHGRELRARTDAAGRFDTWPATLALGTLRAHLADGPDAQPVPLAASALAHEGRDLCLRAWIGPTFALELDGEDARELVAQLEWIEDSGALALSELAALRPGARPWVRFARPPELSLTRNGGRARLALRVLRADGLRAARARVHARPGVQPVPIALALEPAGVLRGLVREDAGAPLAGARVRLARSGAEELAAPILTDARGTWSAAGLAPGAWTVEVLAPLHESARTHVALADGALEGVELALAPLATSPIAGTLASRSGRALPAITLRLRALDEPERTLELAALPLDDGGARLAFQAELPRGTWTITPRSGGFAFEPASRTFAAPELALDFELRDDAPARPLAVRALDAATGAPLEHARFAWITDPARAGARRAAELGGVRAPRALESGTPPLDALADGLDLYWLVEAEGYRSIQGNRASLWREGDELALTVELEPSWRTHLWVGWRDEHGTAHPLPGARLETSAGRLLGETLADGELWAELAYAPGALRLALPGWRPLAGNPHPPGDHPLDAEPQRVWMERER